MSAVMDWDWGYYNHGMSAWGWVAMIVSTLLVLGLLVWGGVLLARALRRPSDGAMAPAPRSAEQILAERFARGEISEEEYRQRLDTLHGVSSGAGRG